MVQIVSMHLDLCAASMRRSSSVPFSPCISGGVCKYCVSARLRRLCIIRSVMLVFSSVSAARDAACGNLRFSARSARSAQVSIETARATRTRLCCRRISSVLYEFSRGDEKVQQC